MTLQLDDLAPDFDVETTEGRIHFHEWIGESWAVLFSHPKNYTPVCTTELGYMARIKHEFDRRGVKIIGLSVDPVDQHAGWANDIAGGGTAGLGLAACQPGGRNHTMRPNRSRSLASLTFLRHASRKQP